MSLRKAEVAMLHAAWPTPEEVEIAREVQIRLLRAEAPRLRTLECRALAIPAHAIGGDWFDFLQPEPGRFVLALGDVSGKGLSAALVMAAVHASIRALCDAGSMGLVPILRSVNRVLDSSTEARHYATLFLAEYDDPSRTLRWVNAGHPSPLVLRRNGDVTRLSPTARALGLFREWDGEVRETRIGPGDVLLAVSDGALEAEDAHGEAFGEARLLASLCMVASLPLPGLLRGIAGDVAAYRGCRPADDLTVVAARGR
jgi:sigma-B regulation protein RsbU (phosphoserine phosphatase)